MPCSCGDSECPCSDRCICTAFLCLCISCLNVRYDLRKTSCFIQYQRQHPQGWVNISRSSLGDSQTDPSRFEVPGSVSDESANTVAYSQQREIAESSNSDKLIPVSKSTEAAERRKSNQFVSLPPKKRFSQSSLPDSNQEETVSPPKRIRHSFEILYKEGYDPFLSYIRQRISERNLRHMESEIMNIETETLKSLKRFVAATGSTSGLTETVIKEEVDIIITRLLEEKNISCSVHPLETEIPKEMKKLDSTFPYVQSQKRLASENIPYSSQQGEVSPAKRNRLLSLSNESVYPDFQFHLPQNIPGSSFGQSTDLNAYRNANLERHKGGLEYTSAFAQPLSSNIPMRMHSWEHTLPITLPSNENIHSGASYQEAECQDPNFHLQRRSVDISQQALNLTCDNTNLQRQESSFISAVSALDETIPYSESESLSKKQACSSQEGKTESSNRSETLDLIGSIRKESIVEHSHTLTFEQLSTDPNVPSSSQEADASHKRDRKYFHLGSEKEQQGLSSHMHENKLYNVNDQRSSHFPEQTEPVSSLYGSVPQTRVSDEPDDLINTLADALRFTLNIPKSLEQTTVSQQHISRCHSTRDEMGNTDYTFQSPKGSIDISRHAFNPQRTDNTNFQGDQSSYTLQFSKQGEPGGSRSEPIQSNPDNLRCSPPVISFERRTVICFARGNSEHTYHQPDSQQSRQDNLKAADHSHSDTESSVEAPVHHNVEERMVDKPMNLFQEETLLDVPTSSALDILNTIVEDEVKKKTADVIHFSSNLNIPAGLGEADISQSQEKNMESQPTTAVIPTISDIIEGEVLKDFLNLPSNPNIPEGPLVLLPLDPKPTKRKQRQRVITSTRNVDTDNPLFDEREAPLCPTVSDTFHNRNEVTSNVTICPGSLQHTLFSMGCSAINEGEHQQQYSRDFSSWEEIEIPPSPIISDAFHARAEASAYTIPPETLQHTVILIEDSSSNETEQQFDRRETSLFREVEVLPSPTVLDAFSNTIENIIKEACNTILDPAYFQHSVVSMQRSSYSESEQVDPADRLHQTLGQDVDLTEPDYSWAEAYRRRPLSNAPTSEISASLSDCEIVYEEVSIDVEKESTVKRTKVITKKDKPLISIPPLETSASQSDLEILSEELSTNIDVGTSENTAEQKDASINISKKQNDNTEEEIMKQSYDTQKHSTKEKDGIEKDLIRQTKEPEKATKKQWVGKKKSIPSQKDETQKGIAKQKIDTQKDIVKQKTSVEKGIAKPKDSVERGISKRKAGIDKSISKPKASAEKSISKPKASAEKDITKPKVVIEKSITKQKADTEKGIAKPKADTEKGIAKPKADTEKGIAKPKADTEKGIAKPKADTEKGIAKPKAGIEKGIAKPKDSLEKNIVKMKGNTGKGTIITHRAGIVKDDARQRADVEKDNPKQKNSAEIDSTTRRTGIKKFTTKQMPDIESDSTKLKSSTKRNTKSQQDDSKRYKDHSTLQYSDVPDESNITKVESMSEAPSTSHSLPLHKKTKSGERKSISETLPGVSSKTSKIKSNISDPSKEKKSTHEKRVPNVSANVLPEKHRTKSSASHQFEKKKPRQGKNIPKARPDVSSGEPENKPSTSTESEKKEYRDGKSLPKIPPDVSHEEPKH